MAVRKPTGTKKPTKKIVKKAQASSKKASPAAAKPPKKAQASSKKPATKVAKAVKKVVKKATKAAKTAEKAVKRVPKALEKAVKKTMKNAKKAAARVTKTLPIRQPAKRAAPPVAANSPSKLASPASLVGKKAPAFRLPDQSGKEISSADLKGKPYVLYFYPKDNTPGCTQEACEFRDEIGNFQRAGVTILGVSPDSVKSHAGFVSKFNLPFSLLSDPDKVLAKAYGVWALKKNYGREYWGIVRCTFLVDESGKVAREWRSVKVGGHVAAVLGEASA